MYPYRLTPHFKCYKKAKQMFVSKTICAITQFNMAEWNNHGSHCMEMTAKSFVFELSEN